MASFGAASLPFKTQEEEFFELVGAEGNDAAEDAALTFSKRSLRHGSQRSNATASLPLQPLHYGFTQLNDKSVSKTVDNQHTSVDSRSRTYKRHDEGDKEFSTRITIYFERVNCKAFAKVESKNYERKHQYYYRSAFFFLSSNK
jgi:arginine utilization protein RocB